MKSRIYVVTHKSFTPPKDQLYLPIQVGKRFTKQELGYLSDDVDENIADKNQNYCELTALYWMWKNDKEADTIGLCHYRRYFTHRPLSKEEKFYLSENDITQILHNYDIIVPKKIYRPEMTVREWYSYCEGWDKDIVELRKSVEHLYPEYLGSYDAVWKSKSAFYCNMFITNRKMFEAYCEWLFTLLFDLEKNIDISGYTVQEARVYGYLSELLFNVWVEHNKLKYKEVAVVNTELSNFQSVKNNIASFVKRVIKKAMVKIGLRSSFKKRGRR